MSGYLDVTTWHRRQQFEFFRRYDLPFWNVCAPLDVTALSRHAHDAGVSLFIAYHYLSLKAANLEESFRYRLRGERVRVYDRIHGSTIVLLDDERFTFCYFDYVDDFERFHRDVAAVIERAKTSGDDLDPQPERDDLIHYSVLPWIPFTSISHARRLDPSDSVPKIAFGKIVERGGRLEMPISVEVHHALMDGLHVGRYFQRLETFLAAPARAL